MDKNKILIIGAVVIVVALVGQSLGFWENLPWVPGDGSDGK